MDDALLHQGQKTIADLFENFDSLLLLGWCSFLNPLLEITIA